MKEYLGRVVFVSAVASLIAVALIRLAMYHTLADVPGFVTHEVGAFILLLGIMSIRFWWLKKKGKI